MSNSATDFNICRECHFVDKNEDRTVPGYPCPVCGKVSQHGARVFFDLSILIILDLLEEAFDAATIELPDTSLSRKNRAHLASVIIFFCALKEALLARFIDDLMEAQHLAPPIRERLLKDNLLHSQKLRYLLPSLIETSWPNALRALSEETNTDFLELDTLIEEATNARNDFLHRANWGCIDRSLAERSRANALGILDLFVKLNNKYVHRHYIVA